MITNYEEFVHIIFRQYEQYGWGEFLNSNWWRKKKMIFRVLLYINVSTTVVER